MTGGGGVQTETFFSPQLILQRGGGGGNGFIAEKTILSQGSRGGPTFSGEVHPRGDPNCYHITCDFLGRGGGAPVYAVCILLRSF